VCGQLLQLNVSRGRHLASLRLKNWILNNLPIVHFPKNLIAALNDIRIVSTPQVRVTAMLSLKCQAVLYRSTQL
jgi:hypothetical protein